MREVNFDLDILGLTLTNSKVFKTSLLQRGWILFYSGVANNERPRAGVKILVALFCLYIGV